MSSYCLNIIIDIQLFHINHIYHLASIGACFVAGVNKTTGLHKKLPNKLNDKIFTTKTRQKLYIAVFIRYNVIVFNDLIKIINQTK